MFGGSFKKGIFVDLQLLPPKREFLTQRPTLHITGTCHTTVSRKFHKTLGERGSPLPSFPNLKGDLNYTGGHFI